MGNKDLHAARTAKNDEFYTQLEDIEKELYFYKEHFKDKVVFCNCDDPYESNFFKYFALNFNALGLKKLICTCYDGSPIADQQLTLFEPAAPYGKQEKTRIAHKIEITEVPDINGDGAIDLTDVKNLLENNKNILTTLEGNGDFRSPECVALLQEADIVVTNPPFSLFREYVAQLVSFNKRFLIIGNTNAVNYKEIFPLIKNDKIWLGCTNYNVGMFFMVPDSFEKYHHLQNGKKIARVSTSCWYTNLEHNRRHQPLILYKMFDALEYRPFDNYTGINVDKVSEIPLDYDGVMGVPITFLDKYCPEQFEILGITCRNYSPEYCTKKYKKEEYPNAADLNGSACLMINGQLKLTYGRILIRKKR